MRLDNQTRSALFRYMHMQRIMNQLRTIRNGKLQILDTISENREDEFDGINF